MWEEINKKQNEDDMIQLLYYSRNLYNRSTNIFIFKLIVVIINIVLALLQKNTIYLSAIFFVIFTSLEIIEQICVKNAAKARNLFDAILFELEEVENNIKIKEKAYTFCRRHKKNYEIQRENSGTDNPPGLKNWYSENNGKTKNEIVFKCQIENTKWDKKITNIDLVIFTVILLIVILGVVHKYYNKTLSELISVIFVGIELIYEIIKRLFLYFKYNKNISNRECLINEFSKNRINKSNLNSLQMLIEKRRKMDLVPINFIHRKISNYMHDIIKNIK